jgi:exonuclease I
LDVGVLGIGVVVGVVTLAFLVEDESTSTFTRTSAHNKTSSGVATTKHHSTLDLKTPKFWKYYFFKKKKKNVVWVSFRFSASYQPVCHLKL